MREFGNENRENGPFDGAQNEPVELSCERHCRRSLACLGLISRSINGGQRLSRRDSQIPCGLLMRLSSVFRPQRVVPLLLAIGLLCARPPFGRVLADEKPKPPAAIVDQAKKSDDQTEKPARELAHPVRPMGNEFLMALALWCGVVVIGLALLTMIVVWGRSLRSLARRRPIPTTAPDPLWYLKTKPPAPNDPSHHIDDDPGSEISGQSPP